MSNKIFILILVWTTIFTLWAWAVPSGNPPAGGGVLFFNTNQQLVISTTTIISGTSVLNMTDSRIINVATPTTAMDAVTKIYVDNNYGGSNATRIWGEGRPNVNVVNTSGECTNTNANPDIVISRSNIAVNWEGASAACPRGWWVCAESERDINGATAGGGTCGSGNKDFFECDWNSSSNDELKDPGDTDRAWVSDWGSSDSGRHVVVGGTGGISEACFALPVLCCRY